MYKYILFDLDGTISDSSEGITKGIQIALKEMGIDIPLHTSVMMNTHNEHAIKKLKEYNIQQNK